MWAPCAGVMGGFWWIVPLVGLLICSIVVLCLVRGLIGGQGFACMGHGEPGGGAGGDLNREVQELREEVQGLKAARP